LSYSECSTTGIKVNNKPEVEKVELNILTESHEDNTNCNTMDKVSRKYSKTHHVIRETTRSTGFNATNKSEDEKLYTECQEDNIMNEDVSFDTMVTTICIMKIQP